MIDYNKNLINNAKELRKSSTRHEKHLWYEYLSKYPVRFQRQKTIGNYIVDFYCAKARLVIELDGSQHYKLHNQLKDTIRTEKLEGYELLVMRIPNLEIDSNFSGVCTAIDILVKSRLS